MAKKVKTWAGAFRHGEHEHVTGPFEAPGRIQAMVLLREHVGIFLDQEKIYKAKVSLWVWPLTERHGKMTIKDKSENGQGTAV